MLTPSDKREYRCLSVTDESRRRCGDAMPVRLIRSEVSVFFGLQVEKQPFIALVTISNECLVAKIRRNRGAQSCFRTRTLMQIVVIFDSDGRNESPEDLITILAG
jgi:hypothetical protein